jgi:hypothetical protein
MSCRHFAIGLVAFLVPKPSPANAQTVTVQQERAIVAPSSTSAGRPNTETFVAANPMDSRHWVAAAIQPGPETMMAGGRCVTFSTRDAGATWRESLIELPTGCGDPWLAFSSPTIVLFLAMGNMGELKLFRSADGGFTWSDTELNLGRNHDHPVLASIVDSAGKLNGAYVVSSQGRREAGVTRYFAYISAIDSSGRSATEPVILRSSNLGNNTLKSAVLADGTLLAPFIDQAHESMAGVAPASPVLERRRVWAYRSTDKGKSFAPPLSITDQCGSARGFAELVADVSKGPFHNRLYFACFRHDGAAAIVARSDDRGERWAMSIAHEVTPGQSPRLARTLSIALGPEGIVGLTWYDRRDDPANECQHLYFAASVDGGVTFSAPHRVSGAPSCPGAAGNRNGWTSRRWQGGGDYSGLAALPDGGFVAVWADSRSGMYQPYSAVIRVRR